MSDKSEGSRILVVDDDQGMLDFLSNQLGSRGFQVQTALSGGQAVRLCGSTHFDVVICDLKMPLMDGIACMERITHQDPSLQVIMISGEGSVDRAVDSIKSGAYDFVQKPLRMEHLLCLIEKAVLKSHMESVAAIYEKSRDILSQMKLEDLLKPALRSAASYFGAEQVCWMSVEDGQLKLVESLGLDDPIARRDALEAGRKAVANLPGASTPVLSTTVFGAGPEANVFLLKRSAVRPPFTSSERHDLSEFAKRLEGIVEAYHQQRSLDLQLVQLRRTYSDLEESKSLLAQKEKLAKLGAMVTRVAHEINNPLSAVMGYANLLRNNCSDDQFKEQLTVIMSEAERCAQMTHDMLNYARVIKPRFRWSRMRESIDACLQLLSPEFKRENVHTRVIATGRDTEICADPDQMKQVLLNLLKNALHATRGRAERCVTVKVDINAERCRLSVRDNGCGIPRDDLQRIFEPYFTTKPESEGNGVGLSVVADIVQAHHGQISVQSIPGEGSEFTLELPVSRPDADTSLDHAA